MRAISVDDRIKEANKDIVKQQAAFMATQEINRINERIDTRKMEIYEQFAPLK
jgi:hypothetical protein